MPGKTFEYLATGREILAISPAGEMQDVLGGFAGVTSFSPQDVAGICQHLARRLAHPATATGHARPLERFDRRHQTGQLADILDQVSTARGARAALAAEPPA